MFDDSCGSSRVHAQGYRRGRERTMIPKEKGRPEGRPDPYSSLPVGLDDVAELDVRQGAADENDTVVHRAARVVLEDHHAV